MVAWIPEDVPTNLLSCRWTQLVLCILREEAKETPVVLLSLEGLDLAHANQQRGMALTTSPPIYMGLLLLLSSGASPFRLHTPGMCSVRQATFLTELPALMCAEEGAAVEAAPAEAAAAAEASGPAKLGDARTILTCARCKAAYPIDADAFGASQRVKCLNCGHEWFQTSDRLQRLPENMELIEYPEKMRCALSQPITWQPPPPPHSRSHRCGVQATDGVGKSRGRAHPR